jgi:hypothetical protein
MECVEIFVGPISQSEADRYLNLLVRFGMIAVQSWGHDKFYVRIEPQQYMQHRRKDDKPFDRIRFAFDRTEEYQKEDVRKAKALRAFTRARVA